MDRRKLSRRLQSLRRALQGSTALFAGPIRKSTAQEGKLLRNTDVLRFGEKAESFFAAFAADAALLHATEGDAEITDEPAVYPDSAGVDFFGDAMGAAEVLCPDAGGEAVITIVRVTDDLVFAVERRDRHDRAEAFFTIRSARNGQIGQNRGREKVAVPAAIVD